MTSAFQEALAAWTELLGVPRVVVDPDRLIDAGRATFATSARVRSIISPGSREEVSACVRIANRFCVPLYPVSSGLNWGYGSGAPVLDGVLLDLSRLNRILEYDEQLAYVTVEPGVTQRQLHRFLEERGSRLWMDATGASPDCSIIANTLERGFGHTPMGDHAAAACGLEIVLPSGEVIESGFGRLGVASRLRSVGRAGVGPSLDGLFLQSNFGIVTRMSVWLLPAPERFEAFFFSTRDERGLGPIVDAVRPLRLDGTLRSVVHIGNDYKVLAGIGQFPWSETGGRSPLDLRTMARIRGRLGLGCWNGSGGLYGSRTQVRDARRRLRSALKGKVDRLVFVDDRLFGLLKRFARPARWLTGWDVERTLSILDPVYNLLKGIPTTVPLFSTYWRKRMVVPADPDPDRDACGLLWCSPVVPCSGREVGEITRLAASMLLDRGFEPQVSVSLVTERSAVCVITISFDRDIPGEDGRAFLCYRELTLALLKRGYPPYRLNVGAMDILNGDRHYNEMVSRLKDVLDPNAILAPGRYEPGAAIETAREREFGVA